jgi:hypothetical protein
MHGGKEKQEKNRTLETEGCGTRRYREPASSSLRLHRGKQRRGKQQKGIA